jgi:hypothetical protein
MTPAEIEALYRDHARRLAGYLMRATNDPEIAADLTAETFAATLVPLPSPPLSAGAPGSTGSTRTRCQAAAASRCCHRRSAASPNRPAGSGGGQAPTGCQAVFSSVRASRRLSGSSVAAS